MSLFGFVKDVGRRLFNKDEEAAAKIKEHILAHNPSVEYLEVTFENGIVGLSGRCTNKAAAAAAEPEETYYVIEKGDSLWKIAARFLGSGNRHPEIFEANREVILDPDKIFPGQKIRIPAR